MRTLRIVSALILVALVLMFSVVNPARAVTRSTAAVDQVAVLPQTNTSLIVAADGPQNKNTRQRAAKTARHNSIPVIPDFVARE